MKLPKFSPSIIAIDGPAASGKSTIGFRLAELTDFVYFDTGVMYRAVTWAVLNKSVDPMDQAAVGQIAQTIQIDIQAPTEDTNDGRQNSILVDRIDVTWHIRTPEVDQTVSFVAANPAVRQALTEQQRRIAHHHGNSSNGIIMIGRDIGTVVVPEAPLKIYLEASSEARAQRRFAEQSQQVTNQGRQSQHNEAMNHQSIENSKLTYDQVLTDIRIRDERDSQRVYAPLKAADDALIVDTSEMSVDEVVEKIVSLAHQRLGQTH